MKRETKAEWHRRVFHGIFKGTTAEGSFAGRSYPAAVRRGDWMGFDCGDRVYDAADPRHVGRIAAINHGYEAKVVWDSTGWISYVPLRDLRKET